MTGATLEVRGLDLDYGTRAVLRDVDASLAPGEMVALIGPNGAGKSSLLRCVTGLLAPTAGEVLIDGENVARMERAALARTLAVVPGQTLVAFPMRVEELVALGRIPHERALLGQREGDRLAVDRALERVGISELRGRDVRELSLGERQLACWRWPWRNRRGCCCSTSRPSTSTCVTRSRSWSCCATSRSATVSPSSPCSTT